MGVFRKSAAHLPNGFGSRAGASREGMIPKSG
jgi:hypothetical protein